jgi:subtilisin family serine protease
MPSLARAPPALRAAGADRSRQTRPRGEQLLFTRLLVTACLAIAIPAHAERLVFAIRCGVPLALGPVTLHIALPAKASLRRWDEGLDPDPAAAGLGAPGPWRLDRGRIFVVDAPDSAAAELALGALASDPRVAWAERDVPRPVASVSLDPLLDDGRQWGLDNRGTSGPYGGQLHADIHAREAWALSRGDTSVRLAVVDTGVDPAEPDLAGTLEDGSSRLVDGYDATLTPGESSDDSLGHGTEVAGVMAARIGDGAHFDSLGVAGVCGGDGDANPGCRLLAVRITAGHAGSATTSDEARGIAWAVDHGARVINLSFAATSPSTLERHAILDALARGALVVCAAGNRALDRPGLPMYPAALAGDGICMSVGASDVWDRRADWSSYGAWLDLVAPGVNIWSTALTHVDAFGTPPPRYVANSGTSFAAPFASGVAGLMLAMRPDLDAGDLAPLMRLDAEPLEPPGPDSMTGAGRLDAWRTLADLGPDCALVHGEAVPFVTTITHDTLTLGEGGQPLMDALGRRAAVARLSMRARVRIPDSLGRPVRVWVRVAHTTTLRDTSALSWIAPWARVVAIDGDSLTMEGALDRIEDARLAPGGIPDTMLRWLPVPPVGARIAYTIWGRVLASPTAVTVAAPGTSRTRLRAAPNPFALVTRLGGEPRDTIDLFDVRGRRVRTLRASPDGTVVWDGRDGAGRPLPAGLYLARAGSGTVGRVIKIE